MTRHSTDDPCSHPIARIYESTSFLSSLHGILLQGRGSVISPTICPLRAFRLSLGFILSKAGAIRPLESLCGQVSSRGTAWRNNSHLQYFLCPSDLRHLENLFQFVS